MSFFALRNYLDSMRVKGAGFFGRKGWGSLEKWKYERYNMASNIKDPIGRTQIQFRLVLKDSPLDFAHEQIICQVTKEKQVLYDITWDPKGGLRFDKKLVPNSTAQVGECSFNSDTIRFLVNPLSSGSSFPGFEELSGEIERKTQRKITTFSVSKGIRKLTWVMDENFEKEMKLKETDTRGGQKEPRNTATLNPADEKIGRFTVYRLDLDDGYDKTEQLIILMGLMAAYVTPLRFNKKQNTISSMFGYLSKPGMKKEQTEKVPYKKRKWYNRL
ncbi:hypothetical protein N7462_005702 [Penicillium macrosclerotiorum]|uniref:uncharacterized protein n=1 Tax=Penicillium macrosclerotiorum TaxID=303699 RepID=UPI0025488411|nr:uncharacterized protein N7462_005702 [Penicillium macrosclerotiorum]KAJ5682537.1 hypothetical protein N7462_005702 [Penicillium macrosclerotiorum]